MQQNEHISLAVTALLLLPLMFFTPSTEDKRELRSGPANSVYNAVATACSGISLFLFSAGGMVIAFYGILRWQSLGRRALTANLINYPPSTLFKDRDVHFNKGLLG